VAEVWQQVYTNMLQIQQHGKRLAVDGGQCAAAAAAAEQLFLDQAGSATQHKTSKHTTPQPPHKLKHSHKHSHHTSTRYTTQLTCSFFPAPNSQLVGAHAASLLLLLLQSLALSEHCLSCCCCCCCWCRAALPRSGLWWTTQTQHITAHHGHRTSTAFSMHTVHCATHLQLLPSPKQPTGGGPRRISAAAAAAALKAFVRL
jgi:hypothetical protein